MGEAAVIRQLMAAELWAPARTVRAPSAASDAAMMPTARPRIDRSAKATGGPAPTASTASIDPQFIAGWEDASPFCAAVCQTDVGLAFCRRCPTSIVDGVVRTGRPSSGTCPAGCGSSPSPPRATHPNSSRSSGPHRQNLARPPVLPARSACRRPPSVALLATLTRPTDEQHSPRPDASDPPMACGPGRSSNVLGSPTEGGLPRRREPR